MTLRLVTERLVLTLPGPEAAGRVLAYLLANRDHLAPWEPPLPEGYLTVGHQAERLARAHEELAEDRALRLYLLDRSDEGGAILGTANFTQISRGGAQSCMLGYALSRDAQGKGLMLEALREAICYVWDELALHRIQANYMPTNERSGRLLRRLGFVVEGYARDYLLIDGQWRDHILAALYRPAK
ncbi:MAG TPA: GNAT family N-acetyltransferase [Haliangiales bacterium]|nr:GNAT family N-acetyltransferase [Haliangiales bacterium]